MLYIYYQAASDNIDWVLAAYEQAASDVVATADQTSVNR